MSYVANYTSRTKEIFVGNFKRFIPLKMEFFNYYKVYRTKADMQIDEIYSRKYLYSVYPVIPNALIDEFIDTVEISLTEILEYHQEREKKANDLIADIRKRLFQIYMTVEMIMKSGVVITTHVRTVFIKKDEYCLLDIINELKETLYGIHEKTGIMEIIYSNIVYAVIFV